MFFLPKIKIYALYPFDHSSQLYRLAISSIKAVHIYKDIALPL